MAMVGEDSGSMYRQAQHKSCGLVLGWRPLGSWYHSRTTTYGQRSFSVSGPSLRNSLLLSVRDPSLTMTQFCTHLKTFLFRQAYCT